MNVEWKDIPGYEGKYCVSSDGRVMNMKTGRVLKQGTYHNHYKNVSLSQDGVKRNFYIHRLVAQGFIPNIENKPCVDHIDRDPNNNSVANLRWATHIENTQNVKPRDLPLHISYHKVGYQVKIQRNNVLYHFFCKTLPEAIAWKEATLNTINTNLQPV